MKTQDPTEAVRALFEDTVTRVPPLSDRQIESHLRDWSGDANLKPIYGSRQELEAIVLPYFQFYLRQPRFEQFDIDENPRWQCAFVRIFYSGRSGLLLLWNGTNRLAVMATGEFPTS